MQNFNKIFLNFRSHQTLNGIPSRPGTFPSFTCFIGVSSSTDEKMPAVMLELTSKMGSIEFLGRLVLSGERSFFEMSFSRI